jgi:hypothetical protein
MTSLLKPTHLKIASACCLKRLKPFSLLHDKKNFVR